MNAQSGHMKEFVIALQSLVGGTNGRGIHENVYHSNGSRAGAKANGDPQRNGKELSKFESAGMLAEKVIPFTDSDF
jgi:hypothetical protein